MLKLYNTLTRQLEKFRPIEGKKVRMYSCGPTVYDFVHIGNLRAFIFADLLKRTLLYNGYDVQHVMNITDVGHLTGDRDMGEDKLAKSAREKRKTAWEIASYYTDAFLSDIKKVNVLLPNRLPKATNHLKEMIALISTLEKKNFTYKTADGIYFDTGKLLDYGKLAKLDLEGLKEGARVEPNPEKRNPTDFALWKFSPPGQKRDMEWQSPWGVGFPGWHIECSAMSAKYLGQPFDIHTGGIDHVPVHHTNEIAQTEAATGQPLANFWLHNEHLLLPEGRIGKSEGNALTLADLEKRGFSSLAFRYLVLSAHYRNKLNFSWEALEAAQNALDNLLSQISEYPEPRGGSLEFEEKFLEAINHDFDTPKALAVVWGLIDSNTPPAAKLQSLFKFDEILGLSFQTAWNELTRPLPTEIKDMVTARENLRSRGQWAEADKLRQLIEAQGFEIKDTDSGPIVKRKV